MRDVYRQVVFALAGSEFTWGDVALAAALRGDWREVVDGAREGSRLLAIEGAPGGPTLLDDEVESAAAAFRYERDLVTAEEAGAWLARWDLDAGEWMSWVASDLLRQRVRIGERPTDPSPDPPEPAVHAEAVCSGALERFARRLAGAAAVAARFEEQLPLATSEAEAPAPAVDGLEDLPFEPPPEGFGPRLRELARLERAWRRHDEAPARTEEVEALVRVRQADWTRVEARVLSLRSEDAAREALLSIRDDGRAAEDVAREAAAGLRSEIFTLGSLDGGLRDRLLAARQGEWLGPIRIGDACCLVFVERKTLPASSDPEVRRLAEGFLRESAAAREVDARVSWRWTK